MKGREGKAEAKARQGVNTFFREFKGEKQTISKSYNCYTPESSLCKDNMNMHIYAMVLKNTVLIKKDN